MPVDLFFALTLLGGAALFAAVARSAARAGARDGSRPRVGNLPFVRLFPLLSLAFLCMVGLILLLPWAALPLMTEKAALWAGGALVALIAVGAVYALRMEEMEK